MPQDSIQQSPKYPNRGASSSSSAFVLSLHEAFIHLPRQLQRQHLSLSCLSWIICPGLIVRAVLSSAARHPLHCISTHRGELEPAATDLFSNYELLHLPSPLLSTGGLVVAAGVWSIPEGESATAPHLWHSSFAAHGSPRSGARRLANTINHLALALNYTSRFSCSICSVGICHAPILSCLSPMFRWFNYVFCDPKSC